MKTFDYAAAWREVARPAYESLPANVRELLARVAIEADGLHQVADLSMPWPAESDLRATFDKVPAEWLALAARVVYCAGHWFPAHGRLDIPGRGAGATWKFSHYADQSLRARLGKPERGPGRFNNPGVSFEVHQGAIRVCWSSRDMWTWREVAPATGGGQQRADQAAEAIRVAVQGIPERNRQERDSAAYAAVEAIDQLAGFAADPSPWWPRIVDTERYMVEEGDQKPDPDAPPVDVEARTRRAIEAERVRVAKKIATLEAERDAVIWFLERGIPTDNLIYYDHEPVWCFGWRSPVGPALLSRILDVISEFGRPYRIKTSDGRTLEGGID